MGLGVRAAQLAAVVSLLAGCAFTPTNLPAAVSLGGFALEGRISVVHGSQNLSGRIEWAHEPERDEIGLASPLGTQLAQLVRDANGVTLTDSERRNHRAADAETLTEQTLGWRLPLAGLLEWVRARPLAGVASEVRRDPVGRMVSMAQSDWQIEYAYDDAVVSAPGLPRRLFMRYLKAVEPLEIRLVIDQWVTR